MGSPICQSVSPTRSAGAARKLLAAATVAGGLLAAAAAAAGPRGGRGDSCHVWVDVLSVDSIVRVKHVAEPVGRCYDIRPASRSSASRSAEPVEEIGPSSRFGSDGDLLRIVSRDAIEVCASREKEVLALSPGLRFGGARAPGQVHELLPRTIPAPIGAALANVRADVADFRWGVRMPGRIERRVRAPVDAGNPACSSSIASAR